MNWTSEQRKLSDLVAWTRNPRKLTPRQEEKLTESIRIFGQVIPYSIGPDNQIYDGHQRQHVMKMMDEYGADCVVDVRVSDRVLTEDERRELVIRLHENTGDWDFEELANLYDFEELDEWGFNENLLETLGFDKDEPAEDPGAEIDKAEELREKWGVESGQLWQLGEHRVICGDCTDKAVVDRLMDGERAGAVVTDPPYGQDQIDVPHDSPEEHAELMSACVANLPTDNAIVIAFQSPRMFQNWLSAISEHIFLRALWLYKEAQETFPWRGWIMKSEMILLSEIGSGEWIDVHPYAHDCYKVSEVSYRTEGIASVRPHGSVKPLVVIEDLVSRVGGLVYDPFLGSGTTLIACERLGRRCYGVEIEPKYVAVTLERWHQMTGETPIIHEGVSGG